MKGTMLVKGETYNQRKAQLLDEIKLTRSFMLQVSKIEHSQDLVYEIVDTQQEIIKQLMQELVELRKWQNERQQMAQKQNN